MTWTQRYWVRPHQAFGPFGARIGTTNRDAWRDSNGKRFKPGQVLLVAVEGLLCRSGTYRALVTFTTNVPFVVQPTLLFRPGSPVPTPTTRAIYPYHPADWSFLRNYRRP